ncbi:UNVERIFIED_CONTAM: hypothetical protein FKN15_031437 [Acipenser sinensis]
MSSALDPARHQPWTLKVTSTSSELDGARLEHWTLKSTGPCTSRALGPEGQQPWNCTSPTLVPARHQLWILHVTSTSRELNPARLEYWTLHVSSTGP